MYSTRVETWPSERRSPWRRVVALIVIIAPLIAGVVYFSRASGNLMALAFHSQLVEHISPFNNALQYPDVSRWMDLATDQGRAIADQMVTLQAVIMAYANDFMLLTAICVLSIPFVFAIGSTATLRGKKMAVEVME